LSRQSTFLLNSLDESEVRTVDEDENGFCEGSMEDTFRKKISTWEFDYRKANIFKKSIANGFDRLFSKVISF
jgi:hypothetical protein